jgi:hypothetical protein
MKSPHPILRLLMHSHPAPRPILMHEDFLLHFQCINISHPTRTITPHIVKTLILTTLLTTWSLSPMHNHPLCIPNPRLVPHPCAHLTPLLVEARLRVVLRVCPNQIGPLTHSPLKLSKVLTRGRCTIINYHRPTIVRMTPTTILYEDHSLIFMSHSLPLLACLPALGQTLLNSVIYYNLITVPLFLHLPAYSPSHHLPIAAFSSLSLE